MSIEKMKQLIEDCISMMEYHVEQTRPIHTTTVAIQAAKEALQAIAEAEQNEPFEYWNAVEGWVKIDEVRRHFDSVGCGTIYKRPGEGRVPLYLAQPTKAEKQEPVAWMTIDSNGEEDDIWYDNPEGKLLEGWSCKPLYTHPQPRKPLTNEQKKSIARRAFKDICKDYPVQDRIILVINDIEAAHGIKE